MVLRLDAVNNFLNHQSIKNNMWHRDLELQVNVKSDGGERIEQTFSGRSYHSYTDGVNTWKSFRVPFNAKTDPNYEDRELNFNLRDKAEAIGTTGWNWKKLHSEFVGFDFDSIIGHKKSGLSQAQLDNIVDRVKQIPWVTVVRSTGGRGIHLFVKLNPFIPTKNHTEHKALAKNILNYLSAMARFDFSAEIDCFGGVMWVWHTKALNIINSKLQLGLHPNIEELYANEELLPFKIIKEGIPLDSVPGNFAEQVKVMSGKKKKTWSGNSRFNLLTSTTKHNDIDEKHRSLMKWLDDNDKMWWWDTDHHMLVCHTYDLKLAHEDLKFKGIFETTSTGQNSGADQNCFAFPLNNGAWVIRRHGQGTKEHPYWETDSSGWTKCYYNRLPSLTAVIRTFGGLLGSKGDYEFSTACQAAEAIQALGLSVEVPDKIDHRRAWLLPKKGEFLVISIEKTKGDPDTIPGWRKQKSTWDKVLKYKTNRDEIEAPDEVIRQVTHKSVHEGWYLKTSNNAWHKQPRQNIIFALKSEGMSNGEIDVVLGKAVKKPWEIVSKPFQPEYLGDRKWNKDTAQLAVSPRRGLDGTPTWDRVLNHLGSNINDFVKRHEWCKKHSIQTGADWLRLWIACLFQFPLQPTPYIFLYSREQETGKSTLHEALSRLFLDRRGYVFADSALTNSSNFNGELRKAVLCVIEETNLNDSKHTINRIKDWVTSESILLHQKGKEPFMIPNTTHWIQCANDERFVPIFPGDTRITMIQVNPLKTQVPRDVFLQKLEDEAPAFLYDVLNMEIPEHHGRLKLPVIETTDKINLAEEHSKSILEVYIEDNFHKVNGAVTKFSDFANRFRSTLNMTEKVYWSTARISREFPKTIPKGKYGREKQIWIGNFSFDKEAESEEPWYVSASGNLVK